MCRKQLLLVQPEYRSTTRRDVASIHKYSARRTPIPLQLFTICELLKWTIIKERRMFVKETRTPNQCDRNLQSVYSV